MRALVVTLGTIAAVFMAAPLAVLVPMSLSTASSLEFPPPGYWIDRYPAFFSDRGWMEAMINSFLIALGTVATTLTLVTPAVFAMVRHRFRGRGLVNVLLMLPLVVPHIVLAVGYYSYFARLGLLQTYAGVVVAHTCLAVPVTFLTLSAALKGYDRNLERAAASLGAGPFRTLLLVTAPVLRPAFLVSALLAFVYSFDETTVALFVSGRDVATLPKKMFDSLRMQADPSVSVASTLLFLIVVAISVLATIWRRGRRWRSNGPLAADPSPSPSAS